MKIHQWVTFPSYPLLSNGIAGTLLSLVISMVFAILPEHMFPFNPPLCSTLKAVVLRRFFLFQLNFD